MSAVKKRRPGRPAIHKNGAPCAKPGCATGPGGTPGVYEAGRCAKGLCYVHTQQEQRRERRIRNAIKSL